MKRLLISETSYARIRGELDAVPGLQSVLVREDGTLTADGSQTSPEDARVDAAWANNDVFQSAAVKPFMTAALKSPNLAWVQSGGAGFEHPVWASFVNKGAVLTTQHVQSFGIAEFVLWGVLDHLQRGPERRRAQAEGRWEKLPFGDIAGSRWLVVGFGAICQDVAVRARAFGAHITGVRRTPGPHPLADAMLEDWKEALPHADVVVLSLPLSRSTAGMADAAAFAAFKPKSVFVNVGRGGLVDEGALIEALARGRPAHAVLDVFAAEPLPPESPFWSHPQVTATAHTSALSSGLVGRSDQIFLKNLHCFLRGEPLHGAVAAEEVLDSAAESGRPG